MELTFPPARGRRRVMGARMWRYLSRLPEFKSNGNCKNSLLIIASAGFSSNSPLSGLGYSSFPHHWSGHLLILSLTFLSRTNLKKEKENNKNLDGVRREEGWGA